MKNTSLLLFLIAAIAMQSFAQKFDWVSFTPLINASSSGGSGGLSVTSDNQGNLYTVAVFNDPIIVGGDTLNHVGNLNRPDILITKWNAQGDVLGYRHIANWSGNGNPDPQVIMFDEVHNEILLTINSYYDGMQVTLLSNGVYPDTLLTLLRGSVLRLKPDMSFVSAKNLPGGGSYATPAVVKDGFLYAAHGYNSTVSKTDTAGNVLWSVTPAGSGFYIADIAISSDDTIFVIGYMNGTTVSMGGKTVTAPSAGNNNQIGIFKIDSSGNVIQGEYLTQASYYTFPLRLTTDLAGNVFVSVTYETQLLQVGSFTLSSSPNGRDVFVAKLSPDLVPLWVREFSSGGDTRAYDIVVHPSGKITLLGDYSGPVTFGNFSLTPASSGYLAHLDNNTGNILYAKNFGAMNGGSGHPNCAVVLGNKYYISGTSYLSNEYNPSFTASYGCFNQTRNRQYLTCFNDTVQPLPQTEFSYIREQNKVYFTSRILNGNFVSIDFGDGTSSSTQKNPVHVYAPGVYKAVLTSRYDCFERKDTIALLFKGIQSVTPKQIANNHLQIIFIKGGFPFANTSGLNVMLKKGNSILNANAVAIHDSGNIQANYLLSNEPLGFYDVIVSAPGFADTLVNGIEMVAEKDVPLTVQVLANKRRLLNRYESVKVAISNCGNVNKFAVPVLIAVHPGNQVGKVVNRVIADSLSNVIRDTVFTNDFMIVRDSLTGDSALLASFVFPMVGANSSEVLEFFVRGTSTGKKPISAVVLEPLYTDSQLVLLGLRTSCDFLPCPVQVGLNTGNLIPLVSCVTSAFSLGCALGNIVNDVTGIRNSQGSVTGYAMDVFNLISDITGIMVCSGGGTIKKFADKIADQLFLKVLDFTFTASSVGLSAVSPNVQPGVNPDSCSPFSEEDEDTEEIEDVASSDPNDKIGLSGQTTENYFNGNRMLHYKIRFENLGSATAPAATVEIYDTLDANFYDISTLRFTGFGFADSAYQILNGTESYAHEMDLRPAKNTIVRFEAKLDTASNSIVWKFNSFDPASRDLVTNISDGFLNPNGTSPEGEGFVSFSILPKPNRPHLQQVSNTAKIVFDENAPVSTNAWINTVDIIKPVSQMQALASVVNDTTFSIAWSGNDAHAGIRGYDIFVIDNDTATSILLRNTIVSTATFTGKFGHTYQFYSVATDFAGNVEDVPTTPDAVVTLQQPNSVSTVATLHPEFKLYPNPTKHQLTIETAMHQPIAIEISDLQGRIVFSDSLRYSKTIDVSLLSAGLYQVKFKGHSITAVKKFLKE